MSVLDSKLEQFIKRGGYEIVRQIKRGKNKGQWRGISAAARKTGLTRPTIYKILEEYPEKPSKVTPKYMDNLWESEGFKAIKTMYKPRISAGMWRQVKQTLREAVKIVGHNKDPISWTEEDYKTLWYHPVFFSQECKGIEKRFATSLRQLMKATNNHNLLAKFKYNNPPEGKKKNWFLHTTDIKKIVPHIEELEFLMKTLVGLTSGARDSGLNSITVEKCDFSDNAIEVYEKKVKGYVLKFPPRPVMDLLKRYVQDMNLKPSDLLFPSSYSKFNDALKEAGKKAGLLKTVTTHILKHTFVSQAHRHGVSGSTISNQTGTELRCLVKFYRAEDEGKLRNEMQGVKYNVQPFWEWASMITLYFRIQYDKIRAAQ